MAERIVSPGVFTNENDQSFLPQGVGEIGAAIVGPTIKGPAFIPTNVNSQGDYRMQFGNSVGEDYTNYTVDEYLNNAGTATIVRVLGIGGYVQTNGGFIVMSGSYGEKTVGVLHRSTTTTALDPDETLELSTVTSAVSGSFYLSVSGSLTSTQSNYSCSFDSTSPNFLGKVLSTNVKTSDVAYGYKLFKNTISELYTIDSDSAVSLQFDDIDFSSTDYQAASTPWIKSQQIGGNTTNLFKLISRGDGNYTNSEIKIGITNVRFDDEVPGDYGTFTVVIREIGDTDRSPKVLETYSNVNLDPDSPNFISRIIGDKYTYFSSGRIRKVGDYANISNYVYVEVSDDVKNKAINTSLVPFGFAAISQTVAAPVGYNLPSCSFVTTQEYNSQYNTRIYYGYNFDFVNTDNLQYLTSDQPLSGVGDNVEFTLNDYTINASSSTDAGIAIIDSTVISARKFLVPMQGGFDGTDPSTPKNMGANITASNTMGYDCSSVTSSGSVAYQRALDILSNTDLYDYNLLFTPGITYDLHPNIISNAIDLCEERSDALYILDSNKLEVTPSTVVNTVNTLDTSYGATYHSWAKILDTNTNRFIFVPPSVVIAGTLSYSDKVSYEWFAPAGLNRGGLNSVVDVYNELNKADRDLLYEGRVNPIANFSRDGFTVFGQKTLQSNPSALDRVSVRRLLIHVKKFIASSSRYLLFENTTQELYNQFINIVTPYLDQIQQQAGLTEFRVVMDDTNNTSDTIDRKELHGSIFLKPTQSAEFIILDFNVTSQGASFDN